MAGPRVRQAKTGLGCVAFCRKRHSIQGVVACSATANCARETIKPTLPNNKRFLSAVVCHTACIVAYSATANCARETIKPTLLNNKRLLSAGVCHTYCSYDTIVKTRGGTCCLKKKTKHVEPTAPVDNDPTPRLENLLCSAPALFPRSESILIHYRPVAQLHVSFTVCIDRCSKHELTKCTARQRTKREVNLRVIVYMFKARRQNRH